MVYQYNAITFGDKGFLVQDNVLMKIRPGVSKIELPDTVTGVADDFKCGSSVVIVYKGKNYNMANLDKLKAAMAE